MKLKLAMCFYSEYLALSQYRSWWVGRCEVGKRWAILGDKWGRVNAVGGQWVHGGAFQGSEDRVSADRLPCEVYLSWWQGILETLTDVEDFFFCYFLFSEIRVLISEYNDSTPSTTWPYQTLITCLTTSVSYSFITWTSTSASTWSWSSPGLHLLTLSLNRTLPKLEHSADQPHHLAPVHLLHHDHPLPGITHHT